MPDRVRSKTPGTLKDVLKSNVRQQQRRSATTASPPEAQRPPRERIKDAARRRTSR
jgi:hypothetical protein